MMANEVIKLPAEVAEKFELVDWEGSSIQIFGKFGRIDLEKMTVKKAEQLVKRGFKKLKLKAVAPAVVETADANSAKNKEKKK